MHKIPKIWVIEIDPHEKLITQTKHKTNVDVAKVLGHSSLDSLGIDEDHYMILDDNGLLHSHNMYYTLNLTKLFKQEDIDTNNRIISLCGKSMLVKIDDFGELTNCDYTLEEVTNAVNWLPQGYKDEPYFEFIPLSDNTIH